MVRQSPIKGNSQVDWIGFVSNVLAIELRTYALRSRCIVRVRDFAMGGGFHARFARAC